MAEARHGGRGGLEVLGVGAGDGGLGLGVQLADGRGRPGRMQRLQARRLIAPSPAAWRSSGTFRVRRAVCSLSPVLAGNFGLDRHMT